MVLPNLTDNQLYRLTSLPYRAGLFISASDKTGGDDSDEQELRAIESLIYGFSDGVFSSELVQNIMTQTIKQKDKWPEWDKDIEKVPEECADALAILSTYVDHKERMAYASRLVEIGEAVALAFREDFSTKSGVARMSAYMKYLSVVKKAKAKNMTVRSFEDFLHISYSERKALEKLSTALGVDYF